MCVHVRIDNRSSSTFTGLTPVFVRPPWRPHPTSKLTVSNCSGLALFFYPNASSVSLEFCNCFTYADSRRSWCFHRNDKELANGRPTSAKSTNVRAWFQRPRFATLPLSSTTEQHMECGDLKTSQPFRRRDPDPNYRRSDAAHMTFSISDKQCAV